MNARLRLLVNNSYFLPPAHSKPELSPIYLTPPASKGSTSPSAFKEFFRVGKKKEKKAPEANGHVTPTGRRGMSPADGPRTMTNDPDRRYGVPRHDLDSVGPTRNRVVVVRETLENLPPPAVRAPFRTRPQTAPETLFIDPTTQYDTPPPTHYPSYNNLRLDAAGLTGNVELDQFAPPGSPWSPTPTSSPSSRGLGGGMDPQERVWRRALLEQAVDLSLSSAASDPGHASPGLQDESFKVLRLSNEETPEPTSPKSSKSKRGWWGKKDKDAEDGPPRRSTSSSNQDYPVLDISAANMRSTHSLEVPPQSHTVASPPNSKRNLGQRIIPNVHANLEELERVHAQRINERDAGLPPALRLKVLPFGSLSSSAPVTPLYHHNPPSTPTLPMTPLRPRPARRRGDDRVDMRASSERVPREFAGYSTIRKTLSSPLLSDLHEMGVDVQDSIPLASSSDSVAAPSLVLQDPHGIRSPVPSNTAESLSNYSEDDSNDHHLVYDRMMASQERPFELRDDDVASLDRWNRSLSSPDQGEGRPSFDSFGARRVRSPDECPARASSTFGFRRSNPSFANPSPLRGSPQDISVDISGDPIAHLVLMESQRSASPGAESQASSMRGYVSALDATFHGSGAPSLRPSSPSSKSFRSIDTRLASINSQGGRPPSPEEMTTTAPISFFDSVQHQSYIDDDGISTDSDVGVDIADADTDVEVDRPPDVQSTIDHDEYENMPRTQTLGRKSLNTIRPAPPFATQFRNASQPQLPLPRGNTGPPLASMFRPYDFLDRKKPLTNTPLSSSSAPSGILSQFKTKKGPLPLPYRPNNSPMVLPESTFDLLSYPHGSAFSLRAGASAGTGSDAGSADTGLRGFETARTQESFYSSQSAAASLSQAGSWRQEQDESMRKLDGMVTQHLEAEKDRLRKIASAARENREERPR